MLPLKFLFVTEDKYPLYRADVAILFAEEFAGRGHRIDWLLQAEHAEGAPRKAQLGGGTAWIAKMDPGMSRRSRVKKNIYDMWNDMRMFGLVRTNQYDFIQVKDKFFSALLAILVAKIYRVKFVYWLSYPFPEAMLYRVSEKISRYPFFDYVRGHVFRFLLYRIIMPNATHVFVQSAQMKEDIAAAGILREKLTPVPMGVSLERVPYPKGGEYNEIHDQDNIVVYLGALDRVRRIDFLVRAFCEVLRNVPDAKLYLIGSSFDPAHVDDLRKLAADLGIGEAVTFTGFIPMREAWRHVARATVAVSPFYPTPILRSTSPTKLIEYMAMGKAVVANDHPEQRQVIADSGGGLCVSYNEAAFASGIVELLMNSERAKAMGMLGRRYVEKHRSYTVLADQVEQRYRELIAGKSS